MTRPRWTRSPHPLSLALCGGLLVSGMFTPAPATALTPAAPPDFGTPAPPPEFGGPGGCTTVESDGSMLCLWVTTVEPGFPPSVETVRSTFNPPDSVTVHDCDRHHELTFYQGGVQRTRQIDLPDCLTPNDDLDTTLFTLNAQLDADKPICVRARNPLTSNKWTRPTCVTIHQDSVDVGNI